MEARMARVLALSTGGGGGRGVGERACRPRGRREAEAGEAGPASVAGPVGWRRPASEQPPFQFF